MNIPATNDFGPEEIERRSFEIITAEMGDAPFSEAELPVVKRVIHTTADFDFAKNLYFSDAVVALAREALGSGCPVVTDTNMAKSGISVKTLEKFGGAVHCHVADADVGEVARRDGRTRSRAAVDKAVGLYGDAVYVFGNAPTALIRLCELMAEKKVGPKLVVGVPVGFVNVVESKELLIESGAPCIVARGRKGGSNVAAAIVNALLYGIA